MPRGDIGKSVSLYLSDRLMIANKWIGPAPARRRGEVQVTLDTVAEAIKDIGITACIAFLF